MSDILSQEQIDALLNGFGGESSSPAPMQPETPAVDRYEAMQNIFNLFCLQASTVITTVINKKTTFALEHCEKANFDSVKDKINTVSLSLILSLKSGFEGKCKLIIKKKDVALLSDLMMMGDGSAEYSEDHKDAIGELFNQVMGAYTTALGSELGITASAGVIEVEEYDLDNPSIQADSYDMISVPLDIEGCESSTVILLVPNEIGDQIVSQASSNSMSPSKADSFGLNMSEIDDLSKVTSFGSDSSSGFTETTLTGTPINAPRENIEMLLDIDLDVSIELGRSLLSIKRILELAPGSIVELDRMAGEPVDLLVNNKVVAKGEVVVIDEAFGIRIVSLVSPEERIKSLK
jgi:flagellar motor switch protein FliN/FliY